MSKISLSRPIKKRRLRETEINDILSFIQPQLGVPFESTKSIIEKNKASLFSQLKEIYIYPSKIPELKETIEKQYYKSLTKPGDNVGIIAAQNIGKEQTQTTLDSFHKAGTSENLLIGGISRFNEILTMTKDPKIISSKIYFKNKHEKLQDLRDEIGLKLMEIHFKNLICQFNLSTFEELSETDKIWHNTSLKIFYPDYRRKNNEKKEKIMIYKLRKDLLYEYKISLNDLKERLLPAIDEPNIHMLFSPITVDPEIHIIHSGKLKDILHLDKNIENIHLFGIPGIKNLYYLFQDNYWYCDTEGTNYKELLSNPIIDNTRTISTDIWDIYNTLGIEASREYLIKELGNIMAENNNSDIQLSLIHI
jgi:DNA-directed RNA polymerase beta' subunit